jgi:flagellin-like hook-associated protein FlgL
MAINDISLTAGMRSNLTSLQQTAQLLDRTQYRLSTGKKVNSAIDNPTAFFAAKSLNSRASIIDGLKDAMGQAIQTVTAADKGITAISSLIEQAKGVAQQAAAAQAVDSMTITLASVAALDTVTVGGVTFTATDSSTPGSDEFYQGGTDAEDAAALAEVINDNTTLTGLGYSASVNGSVVTISRTDYSVTSTDVTTSNGTRLAAASDDATAELDSLVTQYNTIRAQIDTLAADSGYKGKNLLSGSTGSGLLTVKFEGKHSLDVVGFDASSSGLNITEADWNTGQASTAAAAISSDSDLLDTALSTLRTNAAAFSANLSIITTRQEFSTDMVNTLTQGADKLTLADTNEEGANMLMLQTRQSLGTTALSLSAQAAQSVLRLFG